jgi:hypothetical protein
MARRNLDGRYKNNNLPTTIPNSILIARWVESEALALKLLGLSLAAIATRIAAIVRGTQMSITPLPPGIIFPDNYKITAAGCHKAIRRALNREPRVGADLLVQFIMQRTDDLYLALQPAIRRQDTKAIIAAARVLDLQASIGGAKSGKFAAPAPRQPEPEKEEETSPAVIDLFGSAFKVLMDLGVDFPGYVVTPADKQPKMIETTFKKNDEANEQFALQQERKDRDDKSK